MALRDSFAALGGMAADIGATIRRFPLPMAAAALATFVLLGESHDFDWLERWADAFRLFITAMLGFFWLLAAKLWQESGQRPWPAALLFAALGLGFIAWRLYDTPLQDIADFEGPVMYLGPCFILLATVAPFLGRDASDVSYWDFNRAAWLSALLGLAACLILASGISSALYAIEELFNVNVPDELYADTWALALALLWPALALGGMPKTFDTEACQIPWGLKLLAGRILVPLIALYLAILYVYLGKIVVFWELPKGQVATLTSIYATLGVVTYLLVHPLRQDGGAMIKLYHRFFFPALVPLIGLLAVALERRIADYGVTEARYAVGLFGLWLAIGAVSFAIFKLRLKWLSLSLAGLLFLASIGPWGAVALSTQSQLAQLQVLLEKTGLLESGQITPTTTAIDWEDNKRIASIISYFTQSGKGKQLKAWIGAHGLEVKDDYTPTQIVAAFGLDFVSKWQDKPTFNFNRTSTTVVEVTGFDSLVQLSWPHLPVREVAVAGSTDPFQLTYDRTTNELWATAPDGTRLSFALMPLITTLRGLPATPERDDKMWLEVEQNGHRGRLVIEQMNGTLDGDKMRVGSGRGVLLLGRTE